MMAAKTLQTHFPVVHAVYLCQGMSHGSVCRMPLLGTCTRHGWIHKNVTLQDCIEDADIQGKIYRCRRAHP